MTTNTASSPVRTGPSRGIVLVLAVATGAIAANLYYAQPLLSVMGTTLLMSPRTLGVLVTVTQVGFALGLVSSLPAADRFGRRGILLARTASGLLAAVTSWRVVFLTAAALMLVITLVLRRVLPHAPSTSTQPYPAILRSNLSLFRAYSLLRQRALFGAIGFAAFSAFWATLGLHRAASPFTLSTATIGLIGLLGAGGALAANVAGRIRLAHRSAPTVVAVLLIGAAFALLWAGASNLVAILIGVVILDVGVQMLHVLSQRLVHEIDPAARNRVNSISMTFYFIGGAMGSGAATTAWSRTGWTGVCILGLVLAAIGLLLQAVGRRSGAGQLTQ